MASAALALAVGVSSLAGVVDGRIVERQLEVWWFDLVAEPGDRVLVVNASASAGCPADELDDAVVEVIDVERFSEGDAWVRAETSLAELSYEQLQQLGGDCVVYRAAYVRRDQVLACNCLRPQADWMWRLRQQLGGRQLRQLFLPGTHDSAAYAKYLGAVSDNVATKYAVAQAEDLLTQLHYGVRYLDMRISYQPLTAARFWTCHGSYLFRPLVNDTALVRRFLADGRDVVIFDIHGLENFDGQPQAVHDELQQLLLEQLAPWMAPKSLGWNVTLDQLWSIDRRLIVTYNDDAGRDNPFLWPAVRHEWGDVQSLDDLETWLESVMERAAQGLMPAHPWSAQAELTPDAGDVLVDRFGGLRGAADIVNRNATLWFRQRWSSLAAIVSSDFFLGTDMVQLAIDENLRRSP